MQYNAPCKYDHIFTGGNGYSGGGAAGWHCAAPPSTDLGGEGGSNGSDGFYGPRPNHLAGNGTHFILDPDEFKNITVRFVKSHSDFNSGAFLAATVKSLEHALVN